MACTTVGDRCEMWLMGHMQTTESSIPVVNGQSRQLCGAMHAIVKLRIDKLKSTVHRAQGTSMQTLSHICAIHHGSTNTIHRPTGSNGDLHEYSLGAVSRIAAVVNPT